MDHLDDQLGRARCDGGAFRVEPGIRLRLSGGDAFRYLNGQVTRDLNRLGDHEAASACLLTPKGKLCALVLIHREVNDLMIESDPGVGASLRERLERYLVADDVVVAEEECPGRIHCFGAAAGRLDTSCPGLAVTRLGILGRDLPEAPGNTAAKPPVELLDPSVVEILRIERGIPKWGSELGTDTLPPEAGLDRTCIDYDRGCYPGQEVISRLKSIGRVNRLLHGFRGESLRAGMRILGAGDADLGSLTSAAVLPASPESVALGYLPRGTQGPLFASDPLTAGRTPLSITSTFGT